MTEESTQPGKDLILDNAFEPNSASMDTDFRPWDMELKQYLTFMHLSQLAGFVVPMAGLILPIVMWSAHKNDHSLIDQHGKDIVNWIISSVIYMIVSAILFIVVIGIPIMIAVVACSIIFPIIGGMRANEGKSFKYPITIPFIK